MSYTRIIVGTDGSATADKAVEAAADMARQMGAELHIVTAFHAPGGGLGAASGAALVDSGAGAAFNQEAASRVADKAAETWGQGITTHTHTDKRSAADAIVETAADIRADLIVVGSKGMRGAGRVLGSVPNSVAHSASCSVLIVKTD